MNNEIERWAAQAAVADKELARLQKELARLEHELSTSGENLPCRSYGDLCSTISQLRSRCERQAERCAEFHAQLDESRSSESARQERDLAQRGYDVKLNELREVQALIEVRRAAIAEAQSELPLLSSKASGLLAAIDRAKTAVERFQTEVSA